MPIGDIGRNLLLRQERLIERLDGIKSGMHNYQSVKPLIVKLESEVFEYLNFQNRIMEQVFQNPAYEALIEPKQVEFLKVDLKDIKIQALTFFDLHPGGMTDIHPGNFIRDFIEFMTRLTERFRADQEFMVPALEKINHA